MRTLNKLVVAGIASLATGAALTTVAAGSEGSAAQNCVERNNIEAIIDDSGSMSGNDPNELRRTGMELFVQTPGNANRGLGAVEFGSQADTVFPPSPIGQNVDAMVAALQTRISADGATSPTASGDDAGGGTDYNDAFIRGFVDNQGADARIFLTDGGHNENPYGEFHRNGPPTYVVGLGIGAPSPTDADANRLQQIADETGGRYFPDVEQAEVQAVFNTVTAIVGCQPLPKLINFPTFFRSGQSESKRFKPAKQADRVSLVLNWAQPGNRFRISGLTAVGRNGQELATLTGKGKPKKLKLKRLLSETFHALLVRRVKGLRRLRIRVTARALGLGEAPLLQASNVFD